MSKQYLLLISIFIFCCYLFISMTNIDKSNIHYEAKNTEDWGNNIYHPVVRDIEKENNIKFIENTLLTIFYIISIPILVYVK